MRIKMIVLDVFHEVQLTKSALHDVTPHTTVMVFNMILHKVLCLTLALLSSISNKIPYYILPTAKSTEP